MSKRMVAAISMGICSAITGLALGSTPAATAKLELRLQPDKVRHGVPQGFTFLLVNISDHDVRVPMPATQCDDYYFGDIQLQLTFVPLKANFSKPGNGCSKGYGGGQTILDRAKSWKLLHPGESITVHAGRKQLLYQSNRAGSYEFWATYTPANLSAADQMTLTDGGIDYPQQKLISAHLTFQKR